MHTDLLLFLGVNGQISAISATFSVTDHKHVLLIYFDILVPSSFYQTMFGSLKWSVEAWVLENMYQESL